MDSASRANSIKTLQALPVEIERVSHAVIGCAIEVHRSLGPGLLEKLYEEAMVVELQHVGLMHQRQARFDVRHRGVVVGVHVVDLIVAGSVLVELKSAEAIHDAHVAQVISYLHITNMPLGLLINFNAPVLKAGLKRVINTHWCGEPATMQATHHQQSDALP